MEYDDDVSTQEDSGKTVLVSNVHQEHEPEQEQVEAELTLRMEDGLNTIKTQNLTNAEVQEEEKEPNLFDIPNE